MIPPDESSIATLGAVITINVAGFLANQVNPILGTLSIAAGLTLVGIKIYKELTEKNKRG